MADEPLIPPDPAPIDPPVGTTVDLQTLLTDGLKALSGLSPLNQAVVDTQTALSAAQSALQQAAAAKADALVDVQTRGHQLISAITAQFFITE